MIKWKVSKNSIKWLVKFRSTEKWQFRSSEIRSSDRLPNILLWQIISMQLLRALTANDHLIEFHLIKIVIFQLIEISLITWSNYLTLFTWSKVKIMNSVKRLKSCHLIESFINDSIKWKNPSVLFWHLIESSNNGILCF